MKFPLANAGPRERAGFIEAPEIGPAKIVENRIVEIWDSEWILPRLKGEERDRYLEDTEKISLTKPQETAGDTVANKLSIYVGDAEFTFG